jgi:DNA uptake protein ComE-like DNA-binding protein
MKKISLDPLKEWFGYTRRERRSSFILLVIIAAVAGIRFIVPDRQMNIEIIPLGDTISSMDGNQSESTIPLNQKSPPGKNTKPVRIIDLNKCDSAALESLPGLGPVLSARIVRYRNLLGGYADVSQLKEVYGLPEETWDLVSGRLKANPDDIRKININHADYRQLIRLPYFERYEVTAILKYRELKGKVEGIDELVENGVIDSGKVKKVKWYLEFGSTISP